MTARPTRAELERKLAESEELRADLADKCDRLEELNAQLRSLALASGRTQAITVTLPEELRRDPYGTRWFEAVVHYANGYTQVWAAQEGSEFTLPNVPELYVPGHKGAERVTEERQPRRWWELAGRRVRVIERWPSSSNPVRITLRLKP